MKETLLLSISLVLALIVCGQTFAEWFEQKKTQIKYLQSQIVALQSYKDILEKGYQIAKDGTGLIGQIKQADLDQHSDYFASLRTVKLGIQENPVVAMAFRVSMQTQEICQEIAGLTEQEKDQRPDLFTLGTALSAEIKDACLNDEYMLREVTTTGVLQLSDDQRLEMIHMLYDHMLRRYFMSAKARDELSSLLKKTGA